MASVKFDDIRLKKAIKIHNDKIVRKYSSKVFTEVTRLSPKKNTWNDKHTYHRTGNLLESWDLKKTLNGMRLTNNAFYIMYYLYGHRLRNGGITKGNDILGKSVRSVAKKMKIKIHTRGL